jgi:hypothetical protein
VSSPNLADVDARLAELDQLIVKAGDGLLSFWDGDRGNFIRETSPQADGLPALGRTSTNRSLAALIDLLRYLEEEGKGTSDLAKQAIDKVALLSDGYLNDLIEKPDSVRPSLVNGVNMFTDAHLILAVAMVDAWYERSSLAPSSTVMSRGNDRRNQIRAQARAIAAEDRTQLLKDLGGRVHPKDSVHDFVTLHAVRGVDATRRRRGRRSVWADELITRVESSVLAQLGCHSAGAWSQFDPGELAFSATLLDGLSAATTETIVARAIDVVADMQTIDGAWPTSRIVSYAGERLLHVASVEIALALVNMQLNQCARGAMSAAPIVMQSLDRTLGLIRSTHSRVGNVHGWANDRTRWSDVAESWVTAIVVAFLIRFRDLLLQYRQTRVLGSYEGVRMSGDLRESAWADLAIVLTSPPRASTPSISDPTESGKLAVALRDSFIKPAVTQLAQRPEACSMIVPGPPGSRKTTMVESLADALGWPMLTLTPPDFLVDGLDGFERNAARIFQDLMRLRRVVILFDESEDFFKRRDESGKGAPSAVRTLGAFITAGMLPRLQALRANGWCLFVLATNVKLIELDPAAVRRGRFDYQIDMTYPTIAAQHRYLSSKLDAGRLLSTLETALRRHSELGNDGVPWSVLDEMVATFRGRRPPKRADVDAWIVEQCAQVGPPALLP